MDWPNGKTSPATTVTQIPENHRKQSNRVTDESNPRRSMGNGTSENRASPTASDGKLSTGNKGSSDASDDVDERRSIVKNRVAGNRASSSASDDERRSIGNECLKNRASLNTGDEESQSTVTQSRAASSNAGRDERRSASRASSNAGNDDERRSLGSALSESRASSKSRHDERGSLGSGLSKSRASSKARHDERGSIEKRGTGDVSGSKFVRETVRELVAEETFLTAFSEEITTLSVDADREEEEEGDVEYSWAADHGVRKADEETLALVRHGSGLQFPEEKEHGFLPTQELSRQRSEDLFGETYLLANVPAFPEKPEARGRVEEGGKDREGRIVSGLDERARRELAEKLSDRLGIAVATVFYEVMEQRGDMGSKESRVHDLSKLLGAAMKESLVSVLVGSERTVFLENFKNSFIGTYKTIRSVRRAFKPRRGQQSDAQKGKTREEKDGYMADNRKNRTTISSKSVVATGIGNEDERKSEEEMLSFVSGKSWQHNEQSDAEGGSGKSCMDESLQLSIYESSHQEEEGQSGNRGSDSEEELQSSVLGKGSSSVGVSSLMESVGSLVSQSTPDTRDVKADHAKSEGGSSEDGDMYSAANSSDGEGHWVMIEKGEAQITPSVSFAETSSQFAKGRSQLQPPANSYVAESFSRLQQGHTEIPGSGRSSLGGSVLKGTLGSQINASLVQTGGLQFLRERQESGESSVLTPEPSFKRNSGGQEGHAGTMSLHRRRGKGWDEGSSQEDAMLPSVPPYFGHGAVERQSDLFQRSVEAQEASNYLKSLELAQIMKRLSLKEDHLQLQESSNTLMRENVGLVRSKAEFKVSELEDKKLSLAYDALSRTCADELVAGLCVMLVALGYGAWKFSYARLSRIVPTCQLPVFEPRNSGIFGTNWMYTGVDFFSWQLNALTCEVAKWGRMAAGIIILAFVASTLFYRGSTNSSRAMPATILVVLLGGICGIAGKVSIDSLGGRGNHWLYLWECLLLFHVFATCCTPWVYKHLHGGKSNWANFLTRMLFHTLLTIGFPVMAGLLPFASPQELSTIFAEFAGMIGGSNEIK